MYLAIGITLRKKEDGRPFKIESLDVVTGIATLRNMTDGAVRIPWDSTAEIFEEFGPYYQNRLLKRCPCCNSTNLSVEGRGPECLDCGATRSSVALWNARRPGALPATDEQIKAAFLREPDSHATTYQWFAAGVKAASQGAFVPGSSSELNAIHAVVMNIGGDWPEVEGDPYTLHHVKRMAREIQAPSDFKESVGLMLAAIGYTESYARQWPKEKVSVTFKRWFDDQIAQASTATDDVLVKKDGVHFGRNCWVSHEKITGCTAEQLNDGTCGITGRAYMDWVRSRLTSAVPPAGAVQIPCDYSAKDVLEAHTKGYGLVTVGTQYRRKIRPATTVYTVDDVTGDRVHMTGDGGMCGTSLPISVLLEQYEALKNIPPSVKGGV